MRGARAMRKHHILQTSSVFEHMHQHLPCVVISCALGIFLVFIRYPGNACVAQRRHSMAKSGAGLLSSDIRVSGPGQVYPILQTGSGPDCRTIPTAASFSREQNVPATVCPLMSTPEATSYCTVVESYVALAQHLESTSIRSF